MRIGREPTRANHSIAEAIPFKDKEILKCIPYHHRHQSVKGRERRKRGRVVYVEEESVVVQ